MSTVVITPRVPLILINACSDRPCACRTVEQLWASAAQTPQGQYVDGRANRTGARTTAAIATLAAALISIRQSSTGLMWS